MTQDAAFKALAELVGLPTATAIAELFLAMQFEQRQDDAREVIEATQAE